MTSLTTTPSVADGHSSPNAEATGPLFYICGKHSSQSRFRPMNLGEGTRVVNLVYASRLTAEQVNRFFEIEAPRNTEWTFKRRRIPSPRKLRCGPPSNARDDAACTVRS